MNQSTKKYFKEIKALLPIHGTYEKRFLNDFKSNLNEYLQENPDSTYMQICNVFGDPREVIAEYYSNVDTEYLIKQLHKARSIRLAILCIILLVATVSIFRMGLIYLSYLSSEKAIITQEIININ